MSASWSQGGQPAVRPGQRIANPPPVCFNCGIEGHFVVDCPESQQRQAPAAFPPPTNGYQQYPTPQASWPVQAGPPQNQYSPYPPAQQQQQQYGPQSVAPPYNYTQPPQSYHAPSSTQQYGRPPYQASNPQYAPPTGPQQFGSQGYPTSQQSYGPPNVAPYQPPSNYPQNPNFGGNSQSPQKSIPTQYPATQWNDSQSTPHQSFPRPQRANSGYQNDYSRTPSQQSHLPQSQNTLSRHQSFDRGSKEPAQHQQPRRTSQTPSSNHSVTLQAPTQSLSHSSAKPEPKAASVVNTPNLIHESTIVAEVSETKHVAEVSDKLKEQDVEEQEEKPEEGEIGPEDDAEEAFQWDYEHAFEEVEPKETVALAQPLSASFKSTPVPLIQAWSTKVPSISRYARKENAAEYVRTIRSSPQWSYLQEDPAFADSELEGELIPFDEVPAWMAARHGMMPMEESEGDWDNSRKRSRDEGEGEYDWVETGDQENFNDQVTNEESEVDGPRTKRQKQEASDEIKDEIMEESRSIDTLGTMVVIPNARGGTPCLANTLDDAWAPEPGERATSPPNPVEALLASLGVSGDTKPMKQMELPPHIGSGEEASSRHASQTPVGSQPSTSFAPANIQQNQGTPVNQGYAMTNGTSSNQGQPMSNGPSMNGPHNGMNGPPMDGPPNGPPIGPPVNNGYAAPNTAQGQYGPPVNMGYASGPLQQQYQNGPPMNGEYPPSTQYGPPVNGTYGTVPAAQIPYAQTGYGPAANAQYTNGPQNNYSQGAPHYAQPRNPSFGNATQTNNPQGYNQFGPPAPYANGPPQSVSYPQPHYGPPMNQPYGNGPVANYQPGSQYGPPQNQQFGNAQQMPNSYGVNTQMSPVQYGPPQGQQYPPNGGYQAQPYVNGPTPALQYASGPQSNFQYPTGPQAQIPFNNGLNGNVPVRQDSGYFSARGSYSNGPGPDGFNSHSGISPHAQQAQNGVNQPHHGFNNHNSPPQHGPNGFPQGPPSDNNQNRMDSATQVKNEHLQQSEQSVPQDIKNENPGDVIETNEESKTMKKKKESDSALSDLEKELLGELDPTPTRRNPLRKAATKKPQPVVEAAYGRRW